MNLNAEITSQTETHTTDIHIGNHCKNGNHETAPVVIPSDTEVSYYFSRQGYHNTNGGEDITLEKLGEVISDMPKVLSIHDILIESERKFITINANQEYSVDLDFDFSSSLSFGKDLHVTFDYDIDLALNTESLGLNNIVLYMNTSIKNDKLCFILWGTPAQRKEEIIENKDKHLIIKGVHPSPLSANRGFFGSKPFSQAEDFLGIPIWSTLKEPTLF